MVRDGLRPDAEGAEPRWRPRGRLVRKWRAPQLLLKEKEYPAGAEIPLHDHAQAKICLTVGGGCKERREGKDHIYRPWSLQFNPVGSTHAYRIQEGGMRMFSVTLGADLGQALDAPGLTPFCRDLPLAALTGRIYREFVNYRRPSLNVIDDLLGELIARASGQAPQPSGPAPTWMNRALELMHDTYRKNIRLADMADQVGVHRSHLARTFRFYVGCTAAEYTRSLRFLRARRLLAESDASLAEVALRAGFSDQSHLGRVFRRLGGCTPTEMRRRLRGNAGKEEESP